MLDTEPVRRGPDRRVDRRLTFAGLAAAVAFLIAAVASLALPPEIRLGTWLPLHLMLAGGAGTALAAMVPFFAAALAVAPPASPVLRAGSIGFVVLGGMLAAAGRSAGSPPVAALGAWLDVAGFTGVALATLWSLGHATGTRRPLTELAYVVALADVVVGVALAGLLLAGVSEVSGHWAALKPAHGWLNLFGFVCTAIAGTLLHFAPTVAGSRIRRRRVGALAVAALGAGAPTVALGYAAEDGLLVQVGALVTLLGACALAFHGYQAHRDRAGWTTERSWHAFSAGSLLLAPIWLVVAAATAAARVTVHGAEPAGWNVSELVAPLVVGMVAQVLVGALTFLVPALTSGSPGHHARQRRLLGRLATPRLVALNGGVGLLTVAGLRDGAGTTAPIDWLVAAGLGLALAASAVTLALLGRAIAERGD